MRSATRSRSRDVSIGRSTVSQADLHCRILRVWEALSRQLFPSGSLEVAITGRCRVRPSCCVATARVCVTISSNCFRPAEPSE
jgi:hypothetical protein